jgi:hypothetical protein
VLQVPQVLQEVQVNPAQLVTQVNAVQPVQQETLTPNTDSFTLVTLKKDKFLHALPTTPNFGMVTLSFTLKVTNVPTVKILVPLVLV